MNGDNSEKAVLKNVLYKPCDSKIIVDCPLSFIVEVEACKCCRYNAGADTFYIKCEYQSIPEPATYDPFTENIGEKLKELEALKSENKNLRKLLDEINCISAIDSKKQ